MNVEGRQVIKNPFQGITKGPDGEYICLGGFQQIGGEALGYGGTRFPIQKTVFLESGKEERELLTLIEFGNIDDSWKTNVSYKGNVLGTLSIEHFVEFNGVESNSEIILYPPVNNVGQTYYRMDILTSVSLGDLEIPYSLTFLLYPGLNEIRLMGETVGSTVIVKGSEKFSLTRGEGELTEEFDNSMFVNLESCRISVDKKGLCIIPNEKTETQSSGFIYSINPDELKSFMIDFIEKFKLQGNVTPVQLQRYFTRINLGKVMKNKFHVVPFNTEL